MVNEQATANLNHNITSPSVNSEMNNNETGTPHESNQTGNEGTGSNSCVMLILIRIM